MITPYLFSAKKNASLQHDINLSAAFLPCNFSSLCTPELQNTISIRPWLSILRSANACEAERHENHRETMLHLGVASVGGMIELAVFWQKSHEDGCFSQDRPASH